MFCVIDNPSTFWKNLILYNRPKDHMHACVINANLYDKLELEF